MKLIGVIGGMSWESTALYYRCFNETVRERLGGHHSARCLVHSLDFEPLLEAGAAGRWQDVAEQLVSAGQSLEAAGAECLVLAANSAHRVAGELQQRVALPLVHIAQATGEAIQRDGLSRVGIIGTTHVTEDGFYGGYLKTHFGIEVVAPEPEERRMLHAIIIDELTQGRVEPASVHAVEQLIVNMRARNLEGIIVACTELPLLLARAAQAALPCYDTVRLHVDAALQWAGLPAAESR